MTRHVGTQPRSDYELDPERAWRRGLALDAMLASTRPPRTFKGVLRASHQRLNELDDQHAVEVARRLNRKG
ncbi:hypothetical protein [Ramlibacter rhizophilus]|uniref:Uncharacterized protein n=1 Tax=Ramlibacter rhizophilus TaxID=1781167 RepID=A0A4Z0C0Y3_9BURK|nr:hypothetical protein [Ramlibacter rhizophilus]TFZ04871.1 hypothetical protein EZ242_03750 [Ramlibacter rhizophilus]